MEIITDSIILIPSMINIEPQTLLSIFMPVLLLSICSGILLIGSLLYLFVYIFEKKRLFFTILIMGILGFIFTTSEVLVIILSVVANKPLALSFHRIEAISALFYSFALPMLLSDILELGKKFRKFNTVLYKTVFIISLVLLSAAIIYPELFLSSIKPEGTLITPWNFGRGTPGILYRIRDIMIFSATFYTFITIAADIILNRRVQYLGLILTGIIIGTISGGADMIRGMMELDKGLFSSRIYSYFGFGLTIFILLSMISVLRWFLDQAHDIDNARKIRSLGLFAGGIAHDFNNILSGVLGNTTLLMSSLRERKADNEILADIEKAVYRAKNLTMQLLTFSRGGTPVKDITSVENIVEETARFVLTGSGIKPRISCNNQLLHVEADAGQISQVIQNLVLNARDSMAEKGGFIDIKMDNVKIPAPFSRNRKLSDFIKIEIKDYGTGISERIIPYIFDPYYTTKGFGTGLGLSVSHSIVRSHGGDITVKSKPGEGTSFFIFLPATMRKKVPEIRSEIQFKQLTGRILLMDDDPHLRPMLKKMLEHIGLTAECVPDGDTAIEKFNKAKNSNEPFNAVIMDLTISGGMGGVQTSAKIRELDETVPLIVASGYCDDPVMSDYKAYGFSERLVKPFTLDDLRKAMSAVLKN
jgi:signal transduction histidine kinase/ActR/RegA family two-component response regulator